MLTIKDKVEAVVAGVVGAIILVAALGGVDSVLDLPDVHFSSQTGECVRVVNYAESDDYNCYEMPKKYNKVWVLE